MDDSPLPDKLTDLDLAQLRIAFLRAQNAQLALELQRRDAEIAALAHRTLLLDLRGRYGLRPVDALHEDGTIARVAAGPKLTAVPNTPAAC